METLECEQVDLKCNSLADGKPVKTAHDLRYAVILFSARHQSSCSILDSLQLHDFRVREAVEKGIAVI